MMLFRKMTPEDEFFLYGRTRTLRKFKVVGLIASPEFQKCKYLVERLHVSYPEKYDKPEIRGMLNLDWDEYLTDMKRLHGKQYYLLESPVAVYLDEELLGDDGGLVGYTLEKYNLELTIDFEKIADEELIKHFSKIIETYKRKFVFLTIAIDEHVVGSMLFMLYNDLVPKTCANFLNRCAKHFCSHGYKGTPIHRIAKYSWIQCGGFSLQHLHMACENYSVPHDRRGVLSMCNRRRHEDNSTQFFITLAPACWMDYNYVAFGQLIQGAEILNLIEKVSTYYESPNRKIEIVHCGEFTLCPVPDETYAKALNPSYSALFSEEVKDDIDSILSETAFRAGKYCLKTDLQVYLPFSRYSTMFEKYFKELEEQQLETETEIKRMERKNDDMEKKTSLFKSSRPFFIRKKTSKPENEPGL